jgi:error-prone DNA polymerase
MNSRDGRWVNAVGLVLVRQKPGLAKDVLFITIEDETGAADLVVWPMRFKKPRRVVLGSSMMAGSSGKGRSRILSPCSCSTCQATLPIAMKSSSCRPAVAMSSPGAVGRIRGPSRSRLYPRDMFVPDLQIDTLKVKSGNFH